MHAGLEIGLAPKIVLVRVRESETSQPHHIALGSKLATCVERFYSLVAYVFSLFIVFASTATMTTLNKDS
jgi:hypothetical protein